jgi:hypothetical protein
MRRRVSEPTSTFSCDIARAGPRDEGEGGDGRGAISQTVESLRAKNSRWFRPQRERTPKPPTPEEGPVKDEIKTESAKSSSG